VARRIVAVSGVDGLDETMLVGWALIVGLVGVIFWATLRPVRKGN
jgi:hypothetical protein